MTSKFAAAHQESTVNAYKAAKVEVWKKTKKKFGKGYADAVKSATPKKAKKFGASKKPSNAKKGKGGK